MLQLPHHLTLSLSPFSASESHRHVQRSLHVPNSRKPVAGYHVMVSPSATGSPGSRGRFQQLWKIRSRAPSGASGREDISASGQTPRGSRLPFHHLSPSPFSPLSLFPFLQHFFLSYPPRSWPRLFSSVSLIFLLLILPGSPDTLAAPGC